MRTPLLMAYFIHLHRTGQCFFSGGGRGLNLKHFKCLVTHNWELVLLGMIYIISLVRTLIVLILSSSLIVDFQAML